MDDPLGFRGIAKTQEGLDMAGCSGESPVQTRWAYAAQVRGDTGPEERGGCQLSRVEGAERGFHRQISGLSNHKDGKPHREDRMNRYLLPLGLISI